jgi:hypothetical protein
MSKRKTFLLTCLIVSGFFLATSSQAMGKTMKFRVVQSHSRVEIIKAGDVDGHIIGINDTPGLASLDSGEVAVTSQWGTFDYTKGSGIHKGYQRLTFEDGSIIDTKYEGTTRPAPGGKGSLWEGTFLITQGTGKYAGIQGKGRYTGRRVVIGVTVGAQGFVDNIMTYTLP